jgi:hypothetical protein
VQAGVKVEPWQLQNHAEKREEMFMLGVEQVEVLLHWMWSLVSMQLAWFSFVGASLLLLRKN